MNRRGEDYEEAVLDVVMLIPPGSVLTYGDIAEILERGGPRQVGAVMSRSGSGIPWWRVIRAGGRPPLGLESAAVVHYRQESTPLRQHSSRTARAGSHGDILADLSQARWNPEPAEQNALQEIRRRLAGRFADEPPGESLLSEPNDEVTS